MSNDPKIIVALDFETAEQALALAGSIDPASCRLKIGKELFTRCGPALVEELVSRGYGVFLDLKFHDIPNTVAGAVRAAADLGVWMVNVHASGGRRMMEAAGNALAACSQPPLLTAVTVLTSMDSTDLNEIGVRVAPDQQVINLAGLAKDSGLDGVVCSAQEATSLKAAMGSDFLLVTPGIRPAGSVAGDQRRVMTPLQALQAGSDYLVIGRPITGATDPLAALQKLNEEIGAG
jgi:orotidine-5'-phosphate decarboxylase